MTGWPIVVVIAAGIAAWILPAVIVSAAIVWSHRRAAADPVEWYREGFADGTAATIALVQHAEPRPAVIRLEPDGSHGASH